MNADNLSVFDLKPEEKLQLVEDLWDDLSGKPDDIPVHDWQKNELVRRKANLEKVFLPVTTWEEIKHRVRHRDA